MRITAIVVASRRVDFGSRHGVRGRQRDGGDGHGDLLALIGQERMIALSCVKLTGDRSRGWYGRTGELSRKLRRQKTKGKKHARTVGNFPISFPNPGTQSPPKAPPIMVHFLA